MKNSDDIPTTDTTEIKQLINREIAASCLDFYHKPVKTARRNLTNV